MLHNNLEVQVVIRIFLAYKMEVDEQILWFLRTCLLFRHLRRETRRLINKTDVCLEKIYPLSVAYLYRKQCCFSDPRAPKITYRVLSGVHFLFSQHQMRLWHDISQNARNKIIQRLFSLIQTMWTQNKQIKTCKDQKVKQTAKAFLVKSFLFIQQLELTRKVFFLFSSNELPILLFLSFYL